LWLFRERRIGGGIFCGTLIVRGVNPLGQNGSQPPEAGCLRGIGGEVVETLRVGFEVEELDLRPVVVTLFVP
jgi:hypothetical protein